MKRPQSIIRFEQLYLGALVLSLIGGIFNWSASLTLLEADPATAAFGTGFIIGSMLVGVAISLLLWYFTARRGSKVAKWILTIFFAIGLFGIPFSIATLPTSILLTTLVNAILQGLAVFMLFRPDAVAWFNGDTNDVGDVFD